uniref:Epiplakin 1 n=1 Tax=Erpetoichthys calabaricus TaxID=27687 RepID=A0A8C4SNY7_ERPCA
MSQILSDPSDDTKDSIAGVFIPSTKEKMSIYQAMKKGILRPGTALVLLEAQAATGFVIDPVKNTKLSVEEAVAAGLVGRELKDKLLSAERAVTGYTDPYTGDTISLFQSLKKDLIVKDHGIRLLEAQIATGGIIDPVHSHRVPVEVAYQRGYFDEEMSQILSDPTVTGYTDPYTGDTISLFQSLKKDLIVKDHGIRLLEAQIATGGIIDPVHSHRVFFSNYKRRTGHSSQHTLPILSMLLSSKTTLTLILKVPK